MTRKKPTGRRTVSVLSAHPFLLRELERILDQGRFRLQLKRMASSPLTQPEWGPRAPLYVLDGQLPRPTVESVLCAIARRFPHSRILVVSDSFCENDAFRFFRLGVKGLVPYGELQEKLPLALDTVASGGIWAPRVLLSRFLDSLVGSSKIRPPSALSASITGREREVLEAVLANLSNKEIADRLSIAERTVKFHVSNLLAKFDLSRRQDLILHCLGLGTSVDGRAEGPRALAR
jgi:DNA-binding NarL/FixJ family response regulator